MKIRTITVEQYKKLPLTIKVNGRSASKDFGLKLELLDYQKRFLGQEFESLGRGTWAEIEGETIRQNSFGDSVYVLPDWIIAKGSQLEFSF